jgi:DNA polymerase-3 subunit alpha
MKISAIELLSDILETKVRQFTIQLPLPTVSDDLIVRVQEIISKYPGNSALRFSVYDTAENLRVELPSRKIRVKPGNELFRELEAIVPEATWKLN